MPGSSKGPFKKQQTSCERSFSSMPSDLGQETTNVAPISRHPQYYFEEGLIFCVENTYFKIPRRKLCLLSSVFDDLFTLPTDSTSLQKEGFSDEHPIVLQDVSSVDFERFLTYLYPLTTEYSQFTKDWNFDCWYSVLKVAHRYMMEDTCSQAIEALNKISFPDPLTMIRSGLKFDYPAWIRQGYTELVLRQHPLTVEEAQALGYENAIRCAAARETYRTVKGGNIHWALDKWFTGENKLPHDPWSCEGYLYDPRDEP